MVTTRGRRRTSSPVVEEEGQPLIQHQSQVTTRSKPASTAATATIPAATGAEDSAAYTPAEVEEGDSDGHSVKEEDANGTDESSTSRSTTRKRRSAVFEGTPFSGAAHEMSRSPEAKRVKLEDLELHDVQTRTPSPAAITKRKDRTGDATEVGEALEEDLLEPEQENAPEPMDEDVIAEPAEPVLQSTLERWPNLDTLPLLEQFKCVLSQYSVGDLENQDDWNGILQRIIELWDKSQADVLDAGLSAETDHTPIGLATATEPVLLSIATQILHGLTSTSITSSQRATSQLQTPEGKIFAVYQRLFRITRNIYPSKNGFLLETGDSSDDSQEQKIKNIANLVTFLSSCLGLKDIGFYHLHLHFFDVFMNILSTEKQLDLFLEVKIQAYLAAVTNKERPKDLVLDELFPQDIEDRLKRVLLSDDGSLLEGVPDFQMRMLERRKELQNSSIDASSLSQLRNNHQYHGFLQLLVDGVAKQFESLTGRAQTTISPIFHENHTTVSHLTSPQRPITPEHAPEGVNVTASLNGIKAPSRSPMEADSSAATTNPPLYGHPEPPDPGPTAEAQQSSLQESIQKEVEPEEDVSQPVDMSEDIIAQAAKAAQEALLGFTQPSFENTSASYNHSPYGPAVSQETPQSQTTTSAPPVHQSPYAPQPANTASTNDTSLTTTSNPPTTSHSTPYTPAPNVNPTVRQSLLPGDAPYLQSQRPPQQSYYHSASSAYGPPGQSQPTAVLYERARQVANSKSTNTPRNKASNVSQRRPWTLEEEQALMDGLDQVKGPHWSQILVLYGPGGSVNETLRDRTQVQLKDKARNLKLFFLKSKIEVPYYLSFVTGELKSRAPSHVSTFDDTPPRPVMIPDDPTNVNLAARNRPPGGPPQSMFSNSILNLPPLSNGTYKSPYAPISQIQAKPAPVQPPADRNPNANVNITVEQSNEDANQQNVADLASSAAAQVAAALANFNSMDFGLGTPMNGHNNDFGSEEDEAMHHAAHAHSAMEIETNGSGLDDQMEQDHRSASPLDGGVISTPAMVETSLPDAEAGQIPDTNNTNELHNPHHDETNSDPFHTHNSQITNVDSISTATQS